MHYTKRLLVFQPDTRPLKGVSYDAIHKQQAPTRIPGKGKPVKLSTAAESFVRP
jgi:hypothetical protein